MTYRVVWQAGGIRQSEKCGPSKRYAEEFKSKKEAELWSGKLGLSGTNLKKTWPDFVKEYLDYCRTHKAENTVNNFDGPALRSFAEAVGDMPLGAVAPQVIEKWKIALLKKFSPNTVRMRLRALRAAFGYACRLKLLRENPAAEIRMPAAVEVGRVLADDEIQELLENLPVLAARAAVFALHTGLRRGELLNLDWRMVRQAEGVPSEIVIQRAGSVGLDGTFQPKTREPRAVPLHPVAKRVMGSSQKKGQVFGGLTVEILESNLRKARKKAGLGRVRFHDLRHTWATRFMEKTGDLFALMHLGGWRSINSVSQYQHLTRGRKEAILSLDFQISSPNVPPKAVFEGASLGRNLLLKDFKNKEKTVIWEGCVSG